MTWERRQFDDLHVCHGLRLGQTGDSIVYRGLGSRVNDEGTRREQASVDGDGLRSDEGAVSADKFDLGIVESLKEGIGEAVDDGFLLGYNGGEVGEYVAGVSTKGP